jgi:threonine/homoserine/homoserine lactone efflux protein
MDTNGSPHESSRGTFLGVLLTLMGVATICVFALVILSPFLAQVIGAVVVVFMIAGFGCLHYLLWGRSLSQEVAGEREEEEMRARAEQDADAWPPVDDPHPRRRF